MLSVGTCFLIGGKLYTRISSVTFPPEIHVENDRNQTYIGFELDLEIWNPSILTRIERTPNTKFVIDPCIDVTFTNLIGYNSHVIIDDIVSQSYEEYIFLTGQIGLTAIGREVLKPGITPKSTHYGMVFNEGNLTRLPQGEYKMWVKINLMFGKETISNTVTLFVFENETFVVYDTISANWGNVSVFKSCLIYYLFGGVMIILPIVNKFDKKRKKLVF